MCLLLYSFAVAVVSPGVLVRLTRAGSVPRLGVVAWLVAMVSVVASWTIAAAFLVASLRRYRDQPGRLATACLAALCRLFEGGSGPVVQAGLFTLAAAGASVGAVAGAKSENFMTKGLPEDELFVYEDALRKGRSVVIAMAENDAEATRFRELLATEGAESVDAAREQWWIGLRSAEGEHYKIHSRDFGNDEKFYRMGFESALHARTRCKEYDQVMGEMTSQIEDIEKQYPGINAAEAFEKGYKRGRDYYQQICNESKAA